MFDEKIAKAKKANEGSTESNRVSAENKQNTRDRTTTQATIKLPGHRENRVQRWAFFQDFCKQWKNQETAGSRNGDEAEFKLCVEILQLPMYEQYQSADAEKNLDELKEVLEEQVRTGEAKPEKIRELVASVKAKVQIARDSMLHEKFTYVPPQHLKESQ
jgi:hypothetical protein